MFTEYIPNELILFFILYGITGVVPFLAAGYLLLRRGNAIAPGVTPPVRLRRWAAAFFAVLSLAHVWWLLFYLYSRDLQSVNYMALAMLDFVLLSVTFAGMLLAMLQDRRRPIWPALVAMIPFVALCVSYMVSHSHLLELITAVYLLSLGLFFTGYMIFAIRQYGRWLNDNYADLENKKVWLSQTVSLVCMLLFILYVLATNMILIWFVHIIELVLVGLLLWRVETLPVLMDTIAVEETCTAPAQETSQPSIANSQLSTPNCQPSTLNPQLSTLNSKPSTLPFNIERLLEEGCVSTQLYLQHDLTLQQLAQKIGTNRTYLSQYFSRQGITYNSYINNLRINHFISRYQELAAAGQSSIVVQQLASESGYRSYSTFSLAFKQRMGRSVTTWMHESENQ